MYIKLSSFNVYNGTALESLICAEKRKIQCSSDRPRRCKIFRNSNNKYVGKTSTNIIISIFNFGATCKNKRSEKSDQSLIFKSLPTYMRTIFILLVSMNRKLISNQQVSLILDFKMRKQISDLLLLYDFHSVEFSKIRNKFLIFLYIFLFIRY